MTYFPDINPRVLVAFTALHSMIARHFEFYPDERFERNSKLRIIYRIIHKSNDVGYLCTPPTYFNRGSDQVGICL